MRFTIGIGGGGDSRLYVASFNAVGVLFNTVAFTNFIVLAFEAVIVMLFDFLYNSALFASAFLIGAFLTTTFSYVRVVLSIVAFIDGLRARF